MRRSAFERSRRLKIVAGEGGCERIRYRARRLLRRLRRQFFPCILAYVLLNQLIETGSDNPDLCGEPKPEPGGRQEMTMADPGGTVAGAGLDWGGKSEVVAAKSGRVSDEMTPSHESCERLTGKICRTCGHVKTQELTRKFLIGRNITY